jgi:hypothetical protein
MPGARVFTIEQGRSKELTFFAGEGCPDQGSPRVNRTRAKGKQYNAPLPPLSERLAELVRKIEQATNE